MPFSRRDVVIGAGLILLLAVAIVRTAVPDRSRLRPMSIQGLEIPDEPIDSGATLTREASWSPLADIYVMGWQYRNGGEDAWSSLTLLRQPGEIALFTVRGRAGNPANPAFFQNGGVFLVRRGEQLMIRYTINNTGRTGRTMGASALVYFVGAEGN